MTALERATSTLKTLFPQSPKAHTLAEALVADQEQSRRADRVALVTSLTELDAQRLACVKAREPRRAAEEAEYERLRVAAEAARNLWHRSEAEHRAQMIELDRQYDCVDFKLLASASPVIAARTSELRDLVAAAYSSRDSVSDKGIDGRMYLLWTNVASIERRVEPIRAALQDTAHLYREALTDAEIEARFDAIVDALPEIEARPARYRGGDDDAA
jgi:hypothetical protein